MRNWKDDIDLDWTLRDIYANRLKDVADHAKDQLSELIEMGLAEVVDDQCEADQRGVRKIA